MPGENSGPGFDLTHRPTYQPPLPTPWKTGTPTQKLFGRTVPAMPKAPAAPAPKRTATNYTGTVSTSGGGWGGGGGGSSVRAAAPTPPANPPMSINDWLGQDSTYNSQVAAFTKALADYKSQMATNESNYNTNFAARTNDLNITKARSTDDQANDFASRGTYLSGVYGKSYSDLLGDFARRQSDMDTARSQYLSGLQQDYGNFFSQNQIDMTKAKQDAINRRALQYGL